MRKRTGKCLQCGVQMPPQRWPSAVCRPCWRLRHHGSGRPKAAALVAKAIREKRLRPAYAFLCVDCGARAKHYDHRDYSKPLAVVPVCVSCNMRRGPGKWVQYRPVRELEREKAAA